MVIIRCNAIMKPERLVEAYNDIVEMAKKGVILLPACYELLNEVPLDTEIVVITPKSRKENVT